MSATDHKRGAQAGETSYVANHEGVPMRRKALHRSRKPTSRILKWMGIRSCFCSQPEKPTKPETKTVDPLNQGAERSNPPSHSKERTSRSVSFKKHAPDISDHIRQFNDPKYDATNYQSCAISRYFQSLPADWDSEFLVEKQLSEKREQRLFSTKSGRCENDGKSMSDSAAWTTMEHLERFFSMEGATKSIHHSIGGVDHGVSNGAYHFDGEVLDENGPTRMEPSNMNFRAYVSLSRPMSATSPWTAMQATT